MITGIFSSASARSIYEENDFFGYVSIKSGYSRGAEKLRIGDKTNDLKTESVAYDGALGFQTRYLRMEVEIGHIGNDPRSVSFGATKVATTVRAKTYQLNGYVDFFKRQTVRPYLGIGVGAADLEIKYDHNDLKERTLTRFAANAKVGIGIEVMPQLFLDVGYKCQYVNRIETKETLNDVDYKVRRDHLFHNAMIGLRMVF